VGTGTSQLLHLQDRAVLLRLAQVKFHPGKVAQEQMTAMMLFVQETD
jgi:hypothetical protein